MLVSIFRVDVTFSHNKCCSFVGYRRETYRRLSELDTAIIADAFRDRARRIRDDEHTRFAKTVRVSEKWKPAFNSSSKIHKKSHIRIPAFQHKILTGLGRGELYLRSACITSILNRRRDIE